MFYRCREKQVNAKVSQDCFCMMELRVILSLCFILFSYLYYHILYKQLHCVYLISILKVKLLIILKCLLKSCNKTEIFTRHSLKALLTHIILSLLQNDIPILHVINHN